MKVSTEGQSYAVRRIRLVFGISGLGPNRQDRGATTVNKCRESQKKSMVQVHLQMSS